MKKKKSIKFAPIFRPIDIEVVGIDKDRCFNRLMIMHPNDCPKGINPVADNRYMRIYVQI